MNQTIFAGHQRYTRRWLPILIAVGAMSTSVWAQSPPASSPVDIKQTYTKLCAGCHGTTPAVRNKAPGLAGNPWVRRRSVQSLRNVIRKGIPAAGMPSFALPAGTVDALRDDRVAKCVGSREQRARRPAAGKEFFFGKGQCASCHMVYGEGSPIGPDLSNVAREMTVDQIRQSLLQPSAQIAPGYGLVTVRLRDGNAAGIRAKPDQVRLRLAGPEGQVPPVSLDARGCHRRREAIADAAGEGERRMNAESDRLPEQIVGRTARSF